jgi:Mg-chelatase subunit ChlD
MKSVLVFVSLFIAQLCFSQSSLHFENRKMYLGEIEINNAYGINFSYENVSDKSILLSYEPITNLVNATYKKQAIAPGEKGTLKINFYPEAEGPFNEQLYIIVNEKEKIELSVYGTVSSISKSYRSLTDNSKLFGDRDIAFMVVDAQTFIGIPYAKVFIKNVTNQKSYIGIANRFGVLINRIPEGKYNIQALVKDYGKDVLDIKLDPNRNVAMILLDRPEVKDTLVKKDSIPKPILVEAKDSIIPEKVVELKGEDKRVLEPLTITSEVEVLKVNTTSKMDTTTQELLVEESVSNRKPLNLILLIDVSKSMEKPNRIGVLKKSIIHLIKNYEAQDYLAILTFNDRVEALIERSKVKNKEKCIASVQSVLPSGTTDGVLGIDVAFEILKKNYMPDAINMVVIASDGKMNKYAYDDKSMLEKIEKMNEEGILTSVVGFGTSQSYKSKLNQMAEAGGGVYIDMNIDTENLEEVLLNDIYSTLLQVK